MGIFTILFNLEIRIKNSGFFERMFRLICLQPIATVRNERKVIEDDHWANVRSIIELDECFEEACLFEIDSFSHLEIIFYFNQVKDEKIQYGARHPRNNKDYPLVGIFAQRGKNRPNKLGHTIVKLIKREGTQIYVAGLDAIDGTPVLDIKPVFKEFLPKDKIAQPQWSIDLMTKYW